MIPLVLGWLAEKTWPIIAVLVLVALTALAGLLLEHRGAARVQAKWDAAKATQRAVDAGYRARLEADYREISDATRNQLARVRSDAAAADRAGVRLRDVYAGAIARGCPAAAGDEAAPRTADLLADVQRRIDAAAGEFAAVADQRGAAGSACERALTARSAASPTAISAHVVGSGAGATAATSPE